MGMQCKFNLTDLFHAGVEVSINAQHDSTEATDGGASGDLDFNGSCLSNKGVYVNFHISSEGDRPGNDCWFDCGAAEDAHIAAINQLIYWRVPFMVN